MWLLIQAGIKVLVNWPHISVYHANVSTRHLRLCLYMYVCFRKPRILFEYVKRSWSFYQWCPSTNKYNLHIIFRHVDIFQEPTGVPNLEFLVLFRQERSTGTCIISQPTVDVIAPGTLMRSELSLEWRHNELDSVWNHQPHHCLLNRLFGCRSRKTSKLRVTDLCAGNSPGTGEFPAQMASNAENVSIWWRHHVLLMWTQTEFKRTYVNINT